MHRRLADSMFGHVSTKVQFTFDVEAVRRFGEVRMRDGVAESIEEPCQLSWRCDFEVCIIDPQIMTVAWTQQQPVPIEPDGLRIEIFGPVDHSNDLRHWEPFSDITVTVYGG